MSIYFNTLRSAHHKRLTRKKIKSDYKNKLLYLVVQTYDILERWYRGGSNMIASDHPLFPYTANKKSVS